MCSMEIIEISLPTQCVCIYVDKQRMGSDFSSLTNVTIKYSAMLAPKNGSFGWGGPRNYPFSFCDSHLAILKPQVALSREQMNISMPHA